VAAVEEELRRTIIAAFSAERFWGGVTQCLCEECRAISRQLRGRTGNELPDRFLDETCSPTLLDSRAMAVFLPAWLLRELDQLPEEPYGQHSLTETRERMNLQ
jgi:hypothetical protein